MIRVSKDINDVRGANAVLGNLKEELRKKGLSLGAKGWGDDSPIDPDQFDKAFDWISDRWFHQGGWSSLNSSYGLKHILEKDRAKTHEHMYFSNGSFIAAALFVGLAATDISGFNCRLEGPIED